MTLSIHPSARTTPAVRVEIARSTERTGVLAARYGVSTETVRKWRRRGPDDCADHSSRPKTLPWKALKAERLHRLADLPPLYADERPRRGQGHFRTYDLGFVHVDVKHLPKLHVGRGEFRKRYLVVAIDRRSRFVHLAVKDDNTERSALAFLDELVVAFPFRVRYLLTAPATRDNQAYNGRRQRVLHGRSPEDVVRRRLTAKPDLANPQYQPPDPAVMPNAMPPW